MYEPKFPNPNLRPLLLESAAGPAPVAVEVVEPVPVVEEAPVHGVYHHRCETQTNRRIPYQN